VGIFTRSVKTAEFASAPVQAAAGASQVGSFLTYTVGAGEERALSVPTISRARDLIASMVGSLELKHYSKQWNGESYDEVYLPLEPWMERPDPRVTRNFFFANLFSDLFFYGRAFAYVTTRYSTGLPASFTWLPAANIMTPDQQGPQWFGEANQILFNGIEISTADTIQFLSPIQGLLYQGARATSIAIHLDQAADRYATLETVPGYLQQKGGETMDGESLGDLAAAWASARKANAIGALNDYVEFVEYKKDPSEVLQASREYQALELARIANIPPYLVGIATGGMTYQNAQQARQDLYLFGARPYLDALEQGFSMNTVLPRNRYVEFDIDSYLMDNNMSEMPSTPNGVPND
jgi:phage portal protein BeeE